MVPKAETRSQIQELGTSAWTWEAGARRLRPSSLSCSLTLRAVERETWLMEDFPRDDGDSPAPALGPLHTAPTSASTGVSPGRFQLR